MSCLAQSSWKVKYSADDGNLAHLFYLPALACAYRYDRTTGYFTAGALTLAARGLERLVEHDGKMRLLVGCTLNPAEIEAIEKGTELAAVIADHLSGELGNPTNPFENSALELLSWMIANGHLEIRVAVPCDPERRPMHDNSIFHEKTGVIEDGEGSRISFSGSVNETFQGWTQNWESFNVHCSWKPGQEEYVDAEEVSFATLWRGEGKRAITREVPAAVEERLMEYLPPADQQPSRLANAKIEQTSTDKIPLPEQHDPQDDSRIFWNFINDAPRLPENGYQVAEATCAVALWPHQVRAFTRMRAQSQTHLLIADEVGLGKTIQAGILARHLYLTNPAARILILAPKAVTLQWQVEFREKFNILVPLYDGQKLHWYPSRALQHDTSQPVSRDKWHQQKIVIASSHLMRRRDRIGDLIEDADKWDLIIVDEAHHGRRRGDIKSKDRRPNQMLRLLQQLPQITDSLLFLTATPMQVSPTEVWDLLRILGLPNSWTEQSFLRYFEIVAVENPSNEDLKFASGLYRDLEDSFWSLDDTQLKQLLSGESTTKRRKVLKGLRDTTGLKIQQYSASERRLAAIILKGHSPISVLVSRHTRNLLRAYYKQGKIDTPIADREVRDDFVQMSPGEQVVYKKLEHYITTTFNSADPDKRSATGFILTVYRRRVASSFHALACTLTKRLQKLGLTTADDLFLDEEDLPDGLTDDVSADDVDEQARLVAAVEEEQIDIQTLLAESKSLPQDTKVSRLIGHLNQLQKQGYNQTMVFTQFTDSMDMLRDSVAGSTGRIVLCFSGRGGERRSVDGRWVTISREEAKQRFRDGQADILLCTDAAAEGLNFQFCGSLINYDMPWNPMRVEQRIGRIDRLGQRHLTIKIINLHYADTVEADVYAALQKRINLFETFVGRLQPILAQVQETISDLVMESEQTSQYQRQARIQELIQQVDEVENDGFDIDDLASSQFDPATIPEPPYTLEELEIALGREDLLEPGTEVRKLTGGKNHGFRLPGMKQELRVTTDTAFFDLHSESVELWSPGSPLFPLAPADLPTEDESPLREAFERALRGSGEK
jgi:SNF2 family DNA or RNA helicase